MEADCIFCKIVRKEIPADVIYEDTDTLAFLDIKPNAPGHSLVIPKQHAVNLFDADEALIAKCMHAVKQVAPALQETVGAHGMHVNTNNGAAAGQIVFHLHFHLIPRRERSEFEFWPAHDEPKESRTVLAEKIRAKLA